ETRVAVDGVILARLALRCPNAGQAFVRHCDCDSIDWFGYWRKCDYLLDGHRICAEAVACWRPSNFVGASDDSRWRPVLQQLSFASVRRRTRPSQVLLRRGCLRR